MFTRIMSCTLRPEKKEEFLGAARRLRNAYEGQTGFVDLLTLVSEENPNRALVAAVWKKRSDSDDFYKKRAPLLDLEPYLVDNQIEHYTLESSSVFEAVSGKAA